MLRNLSLLILTAALLAACVTQERRKNELLQNSLDTYGAALRWGDFQRALSLVDPEELPEPAQLGFLLERLRNIRPTDYQVVSTLPGPDPDTVVQRATLRFANRHTAVERTIQDEQVWRWDAEAERWWLTPGLPDITRRNCPGQEPRSRTG